MALALSPPTIFRYAIALIILSCLTSKTIAAPENCHLNIASWHKGRPFIYQEGGQQTGIYPELFKLIFKDIPCSTKVIYYPAARIKARVSSQDSDLTFIPRPYGSNLFTGDPKYLKETPEKELFLQQKQHHKIIPTPIFYPLMSLIGTQENYDRISQIKDLSKITIGSINVPQRNARYWKDFYNLPGYPISYNSTQQGLKAVASGRIDAFLAFNTAIQGFPTPERLKIVKPVSTIELRLLIHRAGVAKLSNETLDKLNHRIINLYNDGSIKTIIEKHSKTDYFAWPSLNQEDIKK